MNECGCLIYAVLAGLSILLNAVLFGAAISLKERLKDGDITG